MLQTENRYLQQKLIEDHQKDLLRRADNELMIQQAKQSNSEFQAGILKNAGYSETSHWLNLKEFGKHLFTPLTRAKR